MDFLDPKPDFEDGNTAWYDSFAHGAKAIDNLKTQGWKVVDKRVADSRELDVQLQQGDGQEVLFLKLVNEDHIDLGTLEEDEILGDKPGYLTSIAIIILI